MSTCIVPRQETSRTSHGVRSLKLYSKQSDPLREPPQEDARAKQQQQLSRGLSAHKIQTIVSTRTTQQIMIEKERERGGKKEDTHSLTPHVNYVLSQYIQ